MLRASRAAPDAGLGAVSAAAYLRPAPTTAGRRHRRPLRPRAVRAVSRGPPRRLLRPVPSPFGGEAAPRPSAPRAMAGGSRRSIQWAWVPARRGAPAASAPGDRFHLGRAAAPPGRAGDRGRERPVSPRTEIGQLVENIPRSMRVAVPALIEVRIARADVQALAEGLQGGGAAYQHEVMVTKAMSVRLRAPDGGFYIETASPETQWIEKAMLLSSEDFASWRWHVTPRDKGRRAPAAHHLGAHGQRRRAGGRDGTTRSGDHGARAHQLRQGRRRAGSVGALRPWPAVCSPSSARAPSTPACRRHRLITG